MFAYLASRCAVVVAMWFADQVLPIRFADLAKSWDGSWYYTIAVSGYPRAVPEVGDLVVQSPLGFFPLFPMAARMFGSLPGVGPLTAGVLISLVGGLITTVLVWRIAERIWDLHTANRSAVLFAFFPGSFVFSIPYSEGLMLVLTAGCLLLLHEQRWLLAGMLGALATATRPNALALVPAAAVAAFLAVRSQRRWSALVAPALVPLGFVAFHVFLRTHTGRWDAYLRTQSDGWGQHMSLMTTPDLLRKFLERPFDNTNIAIYVMGLVLGLTAFAFLVRSGAPAYLLAYTASILVLCITSTGLSPRFLLTAFPLVYGLAHRLKPQALGIAVGTEAAVLGTLTFVTLTTLLVTP